MIAIPDHLHVGDWIAGLFHRQLREEEIIATHGLLHQRGVEDIVEERWKDEERNLYV
jgi:hypothetical protein